MLYIVIEEINCGVLQITLFFLKKSSNEGTDWMLTPNLQQAQERSSGSSEDSDTDSSEWDSGELNILFNQAEEDEDAASNNCDKSNAAPE